MSYGTSTVLPCPFEQAVARVRDSLAEQGFGVLTEIDVRATLKAKLDADIEDYVILGACNPALAYQALEVDRSIGLLLPCNVVVRRLDADTTRVEVLDPHLLAQLSDGPGMKDVAANADRRLRTALTTLETA